MMGLLDQWSGDTDMQSPQNQQLMSIAAALMQAGGPSRTPISFGQALGGALQAGNQAFQSAQDRALMLQMKDEDLKLKQFSGKRAQQSFDQQQAWMRKLTGDQGDYGNQPQAQQMPQSIQQPLKLGMSADGNMGFQSQPNIQAPAPQQGQMQQRPQSGGIQNLSLDDLGMAAVVGIPGAKELLDIKKFQLQGMKRENATYIDPVTGKQTYYADPTKGLDYNPETKTVTGLTGFNPANAAMKGAETLAQEQAKAQFNPMIINGVDEYGRSRPEQTTVADFVQQRQGMQQPQAAQTQQFAPQPQSQQQPMQGQAPVQGLPQPMNPTQAELNQRSTQLRANQPQMDNDRLMILQQELANERDPNNRMMLQREIARVGGQAQAQGIQQPQSVQQQQFAPQQSMNQPRFGIPLQSEAQKAEELANVKLRTEPTLTQQVGAVSGKQGTTNALNENWIKQSYNPVLEAGKTSRDILGGLDALKTIDLKTGWGTEAKANAANILTSLGIAPKNAEMYATNAQRFQSVAMGKLLDTLAAQKGPQTEGDAQRAKQTFTMLSNTPQANQFIADFARAKANLDARKAAFYQEALPIAQQTGDLNEIDRRWMKLQGSIWSDPVLQQYKLGAK